jgi:hypothetical protein
MKMYIFIRSDVPDHMVPVCAAHAALGCYLQYKDHENMNTWLSGNFKKVVCKVEISSFEKMKKYPDHIVQRESKLDQEVAIAFCPRYEWPKSFYAYPTWKPEWDRHRLSNLLFCYEDVNIEQQINILIEKSNAFDLLHFEEPENAEIIYSRANNKKYVDPDRIEKEHNLSHLGVINDNNE